jgi:Signal transduction histidine kinase
MSDRTKLKQIMLNLGSNAIKYTERGSVIISVEREKAGPLGNTVKIGFKDTGIGIADSDKDKLFTEFGRAEEVQKLAIEGTGLGLMITAKLPIF